MISKRLGDFKNCRFLKSPRLIRVPSDAVDSSRRPPRPLYLMGETTTITIKVFATLQLKLGTREIQYEGPQITMGELISWLHEWADAHKIDADVTRELLEEDGSIRPGTMLLIDGKNVHHKEGLDTVVDGSVVSVFPPAGGG